MEVHELMEILKETQPFTPIGLQICMRGITISISGDAADLDIVFGKDDQGKRNVFLKIDAQSLIDFGSKRDIG